MKMRTLLFALILSTVVPALAEDSSATVPQDLDNESIATIQPIQMERQTETAVQEKKAASTETSPVAEAKIPVLTNARVKKATGGSSFVRVLMSLIVIALLAVGLIYFSKWYARNFKKSADTNKIRVLTQHFLGPKKSLAIVRVAGESILIGITDQNISMLKTLSLLDEDLPETAPDSFKKTLSAADETEAGSRSGIGATGARSAGETPVDDFMLGNIKDKISSRIKSMRTI